MPIAAAEKPADFKYEAPFFNSYLTLKTPKYYLCSAIVYTVISYGAKIIFPQITLISSIAFGAISAMINMYADSTREILLPKLKSKTCILLLAGVLVVPHIAVSTVAFYHLVFKSLAVALWMLLISDLVAPEILARIDDAVLNNKINNAKKILQELKQDFTFPKLNESFQATERIRTHSSYR